jgi:hypothetical protein
MQKKNSKFFVENILKITTSVPGHTAQTFVLKGIACMVRQNM